ncbi:MAG: DUF559 domain-containing protein [Myxococcales bacterium]|nr:MAG: DUF559 domain-containing protein [Myxococcales bacterium]
MGAVVPSSSFLEYAFVRWILAPATLPGVVAVVQAQSPVTVGERAYRIDYELVGACSRIAIELDGYAFHSARPAFTYDRLRQNDLAIAGRTVLRFSYDAVRTQPARCVAQLQALMGQDPALRPLVNPAPVIETPVMPVGAGVAFAPSPAARPPGVASYFDLIRGRLALATLRDCQREAFAALEHYVRGGGRRAACVMSVGAGKTALGVVACLGLARRRAMIVTPGNVILETFGAAFDVASPRNVLYGLPGGPLLPGCPPPKVLVLDPDRDESRFEAIREVSRETLLGADILVTNFHALGTGRSPGDLLSKLAPEDIDFLVVDEAHIAAAASYQRTFSHFADARTLLMSACFQRRDGRAIEGDVIYRYRLVDALADGHAKGLRLRRFAPDTEATVYEVSWPDGRCEELVGREAVLALLEDETRLARVTAKSPGPIRRLVREVLRALDAQRVALHPVRPRALFSALGERHAAQIAAIACKEGLRCGYVHHAMPAAQLRAVRARFESEGGDLDALVHLRMLGQGYDLPAISVIAPLKPYGSFGEFYQFVGRGLRSVRHPDWRTRPAPPAQCLDVVYHAELGLDAHLEAIRRENDMDPSAYGVVGDVTTEEARDGAMEGLRVVAPQASVLSEAGHFEQRALHDPRSLERRRDERELEGLAQRYSEYAKRTPTPLSFEQFVELMREMQA